MYRRIVCLCLLSLCLLAPGCSKGGNEKLVPVVGTVTVNGEPLTVGSLAFHSDASKGNTSKSEPAGTIDGAGKFKLVTNGRDGAPTGWYKIVVVATAPIDPKN